MQKYKDQLKTKKRRRVIFKLALFLIILAVVFAGIAYLMFFRGFFEVKNITINASDDLRAGVSQAVSEWLNVGFWQFKRHNNILFVSLDGLASRLERQFPKIDSVSIKSDFPHAITVSVIERKPAGIWCVSVQNACFYFDKNGIAYQETVPTSGFLILAITDRRERKIMPGDAVATEEWFKNIMIARDALVKINLSASEFIIPPDSFDEFDAKIAEGWKILFSNQTDIESQLGVLAAFLKEKLAPDQRAKLQYSDLRIQDRIYYK